MFIWIDPAFGGSIDYTYLKLNISLSFAFEFRDEGNLFIIRNKIEWFSSSESCIIKCYVISYQGEKDSFSHLSKSSQMLWK